MNTFIGSGISASQTAADRLESQRMVEALNVNLTGQREVSQDLGKDDFLQLLIAQLANQDPTNPMEDREFIAQMAQFSSLEQMTNMNEGFSELSAMLSGGRATNMLGRYVAVQSGEQQVQGQVTEVTTGSTPMVQVNGRFYPVEDVQSIRSESVN